MCDRLWVRAPLSQTKDYKIGIWIWCFFAKQAKLMSKNKIWLTQNQDSVFKWSNMSTRRLLFQWAIETNDACWSNTKQTLSFDWNRTFSHYDIGEKWLTWHYRQQWLTHSLLRCRPGRDRMIVGFTTTCAISAAGRWFSLGTLISFTNKTNRHDIAEILLKVALNTINRSLITHTGKIHQCRHK